MHTEQRRRVLVLFCGGTIIMKRDDDGALAAPPKREALKTLREIEERLDQIADFEISYIENIDSTNMTPAQWDEILRAIESNYDKYDGFLITHGTDTMAYTAAALSVAIKNLGKPIVLTGSQIPGTELETDARRNLVNAMKVATMDVSGVFVVFDQRVILGSRASKASESRLDAFTSVNGRDAGEIRIGITLDPSLPRRKTDTIAMQPGFEPDIVVYTLTPGCDPRDLSFLLQNERIKGLIIRAYGAGNLPYDFGAFLDQARRKRLPVVVTSQCLHGVTMMSGYDVGGSALERGAIEGYGQSLEMLAVKLMWALGNFRYEDIRDVMQTDLAGEMGA